MVSSLRSRKRRSGGEGADRILCARERAAATDAHARAAEVGRRSTSSRSDAKLLRARCHLANALLLAALVETRLVLLALSEEEVEGRCTRR
jgi:hypothetical protein